MGNHRPLPLDDFEYEEDHCQDIDIGPSDTDNDSSSTSTSTTLSHRDLTSNATISGVRLTHKKHLALEALLTREKDESLDSVSERAGLSRATLYRYMGDKEFIVEYKARVAAELGSQRMPMITALVKGGLSESKNQAAMQRLFWTLVGDLRESLEIAVSGAINVNDSQQSTMLSQLPIEIRKLMLMSLDGGIPADLLKIIRDGLEKFYVNTTNTITGTLYSENQQKLVEVDMDGGGEELQTLPLETQYE